MEAKPRNRESSSFKGKSFPLKWFAGSKKKHLSHEHKKQVLEKKTSGHGNKDYHLLASAIKMSEEDRKTLMIMVKQGDLTVEEAVEQLKRYTHCFCYEPLHFLRFELHTVSFKFNFHSLISRLLLQQCDIFGGLNSIELVGYL